MTPDSSEREPARDLSKVPGEGLTDEEVDAELKRLDKEDAAKAAETTPTAPVAPQPGETKTETSELFAAPTGGASRGNEEIEQVFNDAFEEDLSDRERGIYEAGVRKESVDPDEYANVSQELGEGVVRRYEERRGEVRARLAAKPDGAGIVAQLDSGGISTLTASIVDRAMDEATLPEARAAIANGRYADLHLSLWTRRAAYTATDGRIHIGGFATSGIVAHEAAHSVHPAIRAELTAEVLAVGRALDRADPIVVAAREIADRLHGDQPDFNEPTFRAIYDATVFKFRGRDRATAFAALSDWAAEHFGADSDTAWRFVTEYAAYRGEVDPDYAVSIFRRAVPAGPPGEARPGSQAEPFATGHV